MLLCYILDVCIYIYIFVNIFFLTSLSVSLHNLLDFYNLFCVCCIVMYRQSVTHYVLWLVDSLRLYLYTSNDLLLEWIRLSPYSYESMLFIVRHVPTAFHNGLYKNVSIEVRQWCIEHRTLILYRERHSAFHFSAHVNLCLAKRHCHLAIMFRPFGLLALKNF